MAGFLQDIGFIYDSPKMRSQYDVRVFRNVFLGVYSILVRCFIHSKLHYEILGTRLGLRKNRIYILIFFSLIIKAFSQTMEPISVEFRKLTMHDGLSNNWVNKVIEDSQGFIWISTRNGLNKYDGYDFSVYKYQYDDTLSISNNWVTALLEDHQGDIWIGSNHTGINKYVREKDCFTRYTSDKASIHGYDSQDALCLLESKNKKIWVGTSQDGILIYDRQNNRFDPFLYNDLFSKRIGITSLIQDSDGLIWIATNSASIYCYDSISQGIERVHIPSLVDHRIQTFAKVLFEDSDGDIWIGSRGNGIWRMDRKEKTFYHFENGPDPDQLKHPIVRDICEYGKGRIWFATDNGGINVLEKASGKIHAIRANPYDPYALNSDGIYDLFVDRHENLWISTFNGGVCLLARNRFTFKHYQTILNDKTSLNNNHVISIEASNDGRLWVGTDGGGLNIFDPSQNTFEKIMVAGSSDLALNSRVITALELDSNNRLWVAGFRKGITVYNLSTQETIQFTHSPAEKNGLANNSVWCIKEDRQGNLWIGTLWSGLSKYNVKTEVFKHYFPDPDNPNSLSNRFIVNIFEDMTGRIWVATEGGGLELYDEDTDGFIHHKRNLNATGCISSNVVYGIHQTSDSSLWIGTGDGLNHLDIHSGLFTTYRTEQGLADNQVYDIVEDGAQRLWISTGNGLSCFDLPTKQFSNYYLSDGLQSNQFSKTASAKTTDGRIYFGGIGGLNGFLPEDIHKEQVAPRIVFTDFLLFNESVSVFEKNSVLSKPIDLTRHVELSHRQNIVSIAFAALDFSSPEKINYQYRLSGFKDEWTTTDARARKATYTNLSGGEYTFEVRSSNEIGVWQNNTISLNLIVHPPFWETWYFRASLIVLMIMAVILTYQVRTRAIRKQNTLLETINETLTREIKERVQAEKVAKKSLEEKGVLLQEIHHRVKNNMQIIQSLLNLQSQKIKDPQLAGLFNDSRNRIRSMALIHDKLYQAENLASIDFSEYTQLLVSELVKSFHFKGCPLYTDLDIEPGIHLSVNMAVPMGLVINEIVTNSLKHAFNSASIQEAKITVQMRHSESELILKISDNGPGISGTKPTQPSESIGLTLIDMLVLQQLKGSYTIDSDRGTRYNIHFPFSTS